MRYKKILGGGLLVLLLFSLLSIPAIAGNGNGNGNGNDISIKSNAELAQDRLTELKHGNWHRYGKYKTDHEKAQYNHKLVDINNEIEVYSDLDSSTIISTVEKDNRIRLKDIDSEHKLRSVRIAYSDVANAPGFEDGKILITHYDDLGFADVKWTQEVINQDGYVYFDDLPFSEIVIGGATGVWVVEDSEYLEPTENINIGFSTDPGMVDFLQAYVNDFNVTGSVVGFEWNQSNPSPITRTINVDGETLLNYNFSKHPVWGNIKRCTINTTTSDITYGSNARGDGLDLTGGNGPAMVEIPRFWVKSDNSTGSYIWWVTSYNLSEYGFEVHPAFMQRNGFESEYIYVGAYASVLDTNSTGGLIQNSYTDEQPWTGGEIDSLAFSGGSTEFNIGDNVTGETSGAYGHVVNYYVSSGSWGGNNAAGNVYLKQVNGTFQAENLQVSASTIAVSSGANSPLSLTMDQMETYANNIGSGWGETNFWTLSAAKLLMFTEWANLDSQTALGLGVVDLAVGTGFAGVENGADSADSNIAENGTGTGTGINGYTPVVWRGIENPYWGNAYTGVIGYTAVDSGYRLAKRDGTGDLAAVLTAGNYEESVAVPIVTDGFIKDIEYEYLLQYAFIASDTGGGSTTYIPDYQSSHSAGETNVLFVGGRWSNGAVAGVNRLASTYVASSSFGDFGARLEYIPVITENASSPSIASPNIKFKTNSNSTYSTGWNSASDNPVSIPYSSSDAPITHVSTSYGVLGLLDLNVTIGCLENTTIISEELTDEYYRLYITHIPGNDYVSGYVNYTSNANDILDSPFLNTSFSTNNGNAAYSLSTYDWVITTGPLTASTTYNYVLTAFLEGTDIDDVVRTGGFGYDGLGAYEADGNETIIIGSRYTAYSSITGEWTGATRGSDIYIPVAAIILIVTVIMGISFAVNSLNRYKEE